MAKINPRKVNVFLFDGVNLLDIAGPVQAFTSASLSAPSAYSLRYISSDGRPVRACCGLELVADEALDSQTDADDLLIPGGRGVDACLSDTALIAVIKNWLEERKNRRLISICSGALVLAASGVLDGCKATTHWSRATMARERFPRVDWQLDRIYVTGEQIFTSAGVTTGIDMALSIIRRDCGPETSLAVGRELVVQMQRSGGQEQFSASLAGQQAGDPALSRLVKLIVAQPADDWTLEAMAQSARMGLRSVSRKFNDHVGMSPAKFVERVRIDCARDLLLGGEDLKRIAVMSGFGDSQRMRRAFMRHLGLSAAEYAANFSDPAASSV